MQRRDTIHLGIGLALGVVLGVCATIGANGVMRGSILPDCRRQVAECAAETAELREKADAFAARQAAMAERLATLQGILQRLDALSKHVAEPESKGR